MNNSLENPYLTEPNKLDKSNYMDCKFNIHTLMEGTNVWPIVCRHESKLEVLTKVHNWEPHERKEKLILKMFVKNNINFHIGDYKKFRER